MLEGKCYLPFFFYNWLVSLWLTGIRALLDSQPCMAVESTHFELTMSKWLNLAHIPSQKDTNELICIWLPEQSHKSALTRQHLCQYILGLTVIGPKSSLVDLPIYLTTQYCNCLTSESRVGISKAWFCGHLTILWRFRCIVKDIKWSSCYVWVD